MLYFEGSFLVHVLFCLTFVLLTDLLIDLVAVVLCNSSVVTVDVAVAVCAAAVAVDDILRRLSVMRLFCR